MLHRSIGGTSLEAQQQPRSGYEQALATRRKPRPWGPVPPEAVAADPQRRRPHNQRRSPRLPRTRPTARRASGRGMPTLGGLSHFGPTPLTHPRRASTVSVAQAFEGSIDSIGELLQSRGQLRATRGASLPSNRRARWPASVSNSNAAATPPGRSVSPPGSLVFIVAPWVISSRGPLGVLVPGGRHARPEAFRHLSSSVRSVG